MRSSRGPRRRSIGSSWNTCTFRRRRSAPSAIGARINSGSVWVRWLCGAGNPANAAYFSRNRTPALIVGLQACGGRPRPPVPLREERVVEDPRTVENPAQPVGEQPGLETRRRRGRPPHMVSSLLVGRRPIPTDLEVRPTTFRSISRHWEKYAALGNPACSQDWPPHKQTEDG